jgi:hypothetical protein
MTDDWTVVGKRESVGVSRGRGRGSHDERTREMTFRPQEVLRPQRGSYGGSRGRGWDGPVPQRAYAPCPHPRDYDSRSASAVRDEGHAVRDEGHAVRDEGHAMRDDRGTFFHHPRETPLEYDPCGRSLSFIKKFGTDISCKERSSERGEHGAFITRGSTRNRGGELILHLSLTSREKSLPCGNGAIFCSTDCLSTWLDARDDPYTNTGQVMDYCIMCRDRSVLGTPRTDFKTGERVESYPRALVSLITYAKLKTGTRCKVYVFGFCCSKECGLRYKEMWEEQIRESNWNGSSGDNPVTMTLMEGKRGKARMAIKSATHTLIDGGASTEWGHVRGNVSGATSTSLSTPVPVPVAVPVDVAVAVDVVASPSASALVSSSPSSVLSTTSITLGGEEANEMGEGEDEEEIDMSDFLA